MKLGNAYTESYCALGCLGGNPGSLTPFFHVGRKLTQETYCQYEGHDIAEKAMPWQAVPVSCR